MPVVDMWVIWATTWRTFHPSHGDGSSQLSSSAARTSNSSAVDVPTVPAAPLFLSGVVGMIERMFGVETVDDNQVWVPASLEVVPPGAVLAAMLDDIDVEMASGFDRVRVLRAHERMQAHYAARSLHTIAGVMEALDESDLVEDCVEDATSAEIAAALRLTRRFADQQVQLAIELQGRLPNVWAALCDGDIDVRRARVLVDDTVHLTVVQAREVVGRVLGDAGLLTTGQLRAPLRKLCIQSDPDDAKTRYGTAVEDRRVATDADPDGVGHLYVLNVPPPPSPSS